MTGLEFSDLIGETVKKGLIAKSLSLEEAQYVAEVISSYQLNGSYIDEDSQINILKQLVTYLPELSSNLTTLISIQDEKLVTDAAISLNEIKKND